MKKDCVKKLEEHLYDFLDREAAEEICKAIEEHLVNCKDCRMVVDSARKTILLYQADREMPMPPALTLKLQQVLAREYDKSTSSD